MKEKINITDLKEFLKDFEVSSETQILEEGKEKDEIIAIAKARGINLKKNKDLAGFKNIYAFANKANKNKTRLPKAKLLKALPTIIGKPIDIDHERKYVVGHYIDYRYREKDDAVIAYGIFYKNSFMDEWGTVKKLFKKKKLATSFEIWCPDNKRKKLDDGTIELQEMTIAGGAILFKEEPAFEDAKVLELAKKNIDLNENLVFASKYKEKDLITADYFKDEVRKNIENLKKEKEEAKPSKEEPKEEVKKEEKVKEKIEEKKVEDIPKPENVISKINCTNCSEVIDINIGQTEIKCPKCFSILDSIGNVKYPPQIKDFKMMCPSCQVNNWLILSNKEEQTDLRCLSCSKEYKIDFKITEPEGIKTDGEILKNKLHFLYNGFTNCYQCGHRIPIIGTSLQESHTIKCTDCGLEFKLDKTKRNKYRQIIKISEITGDKIKNKSSEKGGNEMDKEKVEKTLDKKIDEKVDEPKKKEVELKEQKDESKEKASVKDVKTDEKLEEKDDKTPKVEDIKEEPKEILEESKSKVIRKAVKKIMNLKKSNKLVKISFETNEKKLKDGIKKVASKLIEAKAEIKKITSEADKKIKFYLENARIIIERKTELGDDFAKNMSDKDILDNDKFTNAKLERENVLLRAKLENSSDTVGDKSNERDTEFYTDTRKKVDDLAFGKKNKTE